MILYLKDNSQKYQAEGKDLNSVFFYRSVWVKPSNKDMEDIYFDAKIDTGAFISTLFFRKRDLIKTDGFILKNSKGNVPGVTAANGTRLNGAYCKITLKFREKGPWHHLPVLLVEDPDQSKLLLGSLGFMANHNLVLVPGKTNASIVY